MKKLKSIFSIFISIFSPNQLSEEEKVRRFKKNKLIFAKVIINHIEDTKIESKVTQVTFIGQMHYTEDKFGIQKNKMLEGNYLPYFQEDIFTTDYRYVDIFLIDTSDNKHYIYVFSHESSLELPDYCLDFFEISNRPLTKHLSNKEHPEFNNERDFIHYDFKEDGNIT